MLKKKRLQKKLTQAKLAELANTSQNYISELENKRKIPTLQVLKRLSIILDINCLDLIQNYICSNCNYKTERCSTSFNSENQQNIYD